MNEKLILILNKTMNLSQKSLNVFRGIVQRYGSEYAKRRLWNEEFANGRWDFLDSSDDERVRLQVEKYANYGDILDLGCGSGTTSIELNENLYGFYTGVDISDVAVQKSRARTQEAGRSLRSEYCQSDILTYEPTRLYQVILYRDSIYYVPTARIVKTLNRYSAYLTRGGTFIVRMFDISGDRREILDLIESHFDVVERHIHGQTCVIVFRPLVAHPE